MILISSTFSCLAGDIRRSMSDCSSASSAPVQWRGSWGSVQSYNSYNPQRGVLEERYANWRVQAALNWSSSMAPFYSHTGLPLSFPWQTPMTVPAGHVGSGPTSPAAFWPYHALWPVYMIGPPLASHVSGTVPTHAKASPFGPPVSKLLNNAPEVSLRRCSLNFFSSTAAFKRNFCADNCVELPAEHGSEWRAICRGRRPCYRLTRR